MRTVLVVQARTGSKRLPGKVLMKVGPKTVIEHVLERAKQIRHVDDWVLTTPFLPEDRPLGVAALAAGFFWYPADHSNLLRVFCDIGRMWKADALVRITADCPLLDPQGSSAVVLYFDIHEYDYVSNCDESTDGWDTEVVRLSTLRLALRDADPAEREHVTLHVRRSPLKFSLGYFIPRRIPNNEKWSIDTIEDLARVRRRYEETAVSA